MDAESVCESWSVFFTLLSNLLERAGRDSSELNESKLSFYIAELNSRLSCLMSIVSLINQIQSHEEAVQSVLQRIESLVEHISHDLLPQLRDALERSRASPRTVIYCHNLGDSDQAAEQICHLRSLGFTWKEISDLFGISRMTMFRMRSDLGLTDDCKFSQITDSELKSLVLNIKEEFPDCGERIVMGAIRSKGLRVQRHRVRSIIHEVDPINTPLRWIPRIIRKPYSVPGPMSLWHIGECMSCFMQYRIYL